MRYEIQRGICDLLRVELEAGEAVIAEVGTFLFARDAVEWDVTLPWPAASNNDRKPPRESPPAHSQEDMPGAWRSRFHAVKESACLWACQPSDRLVACQLSVLA